MRIALVRQRYTPYGGAERFVARAIDALSRHGASVAVFARGWDARSTGRTIRCDPFYLGRLWRDWGFARAVCRELRRQSFDLVQSHERLTCCDVYRAGDGVHRQWLEHRKRAGGPLARLRLTWSPYHRYVLDAERRTFTNPQLRAVICNSFMVAGEIRRHFGVAPDKLHVLYSGVDLEAFHPRIGPEEGRALRARLGIPDDAMTYLLVGSGFGRKGLPLLLRALAELPDRRARLLIVGRDRTESRMRRLAGRLGLSSRVYFAGAQAEVAPWYGAADCLALPSLYDPFPNTVLEALACGLPVIVSDHSGAAELVRPGENGYVCGALDVDGLVGAMATVAAADRVRMAKMARATVASLSLDAMAERLLALYRTLLAATPREG